MTLFDIIARNERVIVWSDETERLIYTWNKSLTLQCFAERHRLPGLWWEIDIRTLSKEPATYEEACSAAREWCTST